MNKSELTAAIAEKAQVSKADAGRMLAAFIDTVTESLAKGESVQIIGFGTFEVSEYGPRTGRNPSNGQTIEIPAGKRPKFSAGAALKKAVNA